MQSGSSAVRTTALIACVTTIIGTALQIWGLARQAQPGWGAVTIFAILTVLYVALSWFYFATWRNRAGLALSPKLRLLALCGGVLLGLLILAEIWWWAGSFSSISVLSSRRHWTGSDTLALASIFPDVGAIALLIALGCQHERAATEDSVSKMLSSATNLAGILWGARTAIQCIGFVSLPFAYFLFLRQYWIAAGRTPSLMELMRRPTQYLIETACLLIAPYVVWRSIRQRPKST